MQLEEVIRSRTVRYFAFAVLLAFAMPFLFSAIEALGHNIPSFPDTDRVSDYIKGCFTAIFFFVLIALSPVPPVDKKNLLLAWLAKTLVVLILMLFYEANYGLDAYWYYERSQDKFSNFADVTIGNGTEAIIAALWSMEHYLIPTGSYHTQKVICAFLGLLGIYLFYRALKRSCDCLPDRFLLGLCLFPSILFWSSTLGKDAVNIFGICLTFYGMLRFNERKNPLYFLPVVFGLSIVLMLRSWLVPMLLLPFTIGVVMKFRNILVRLVILGALGGGCYVGVQKYGNLLTSEGAEQAAKTAGKVARSWQRGGSAGDVPIIETPADALKFLPIGMFTALFRPLPGEVMNPFGLLAGIESMGLLYLLWRAWREWTWETWKDPLVIWFLTFVILWSILYAFISPQNLGASVRFRLQVLPAMLFLFAYVGYFKPRDLALHSASNSPHNT